MATVKPKRAVVERDVAKDCERFAPFEEPPPCVGVSCSVTELAAILAGQGRGLVMPGIS